MTLQAVDGSGEDTNHLHSVVVKIDGDGADFDIEGLLQTLDGTSMEVLRPDLEAKYAPWTYMSSESAFRKINSIYRNLSRYAARAEPTMAPRPVRPQARSGVEDRASSQSWTQGSRSRAQTAAAGRAEPRKRKNDSPLTTDPSQKRRKSTAGAGSSGSALTHVDHRLGRKDDPILDFEKFAKA